METMKEKIKKVDGSNPSKAVEIIRGRGGTPMVEDDERLFTAIMAGYEIDAEIRQLQERLTQHKKIIEESVRKLNLDKGTVTCRIAVCGTTISATVIDKDKIVITDPDMLHKKLGDPRFGDLVRIKTIYEPTPKLVDLLVDADHGQFIRDCMSLKTSAMHITFKKEVKDDK